MTSCDTALFLPTGESYGGVYVPLLAQRILDGNDRAAAARQQHSTQSRQLQQQPRGPHAVPLVGYMVGNPVTDEQFDEGASQVEFAINHGLIDPETYDRAKRACQVSHASNNLARTWSLRGLVLHGCAAGMQTGCTLTCAAAMSGGID